MYHSTVEILANWKAVTLLGTTCSLAPSSGSSCPLLPEHFFFPPWRQRAAEEFWRRTRAAGTSGEGLLVKAGRCTRGDLRGPEAVEGWSEADRRRSLEVRTEVQSRGWPRGGDLEAGGRGVCRERGSFRPRGPLPAEESQFSLPGLPFAVRLCGPKRVCSPRAVPFWTRGTVNHP